MDIHTMTMRHELLTSVSSALYVVANRATAANVSLAILPQQMGIRMVKMSLTSNFTALDAIPLVAPVAPRDGPVDTTALK